MLRRILSLSPALAATAVRGLGGVGFAVGSLLLARALSPPVFGLVALGLALMNLAIPLAPLGADGVVNRHLLRPSPRLLARVLCTSALAAALVAALSLAFYELDPPLIAVVVVGVLGGGATYLASACLQAQRRFGPALALSEQGNWTLTLAAVVALVWGVETALLPLAFVSAGQILAALLAWPRLLREPAATRASPPYPRREGIAIAGMGAAVVILLQLDRLLIPRVLGLESLASFAVLAAVALAPFRMLQNGVSFTLLPRLRGAPVHARSRLLLREGALVGAVAGATSVAVLLFGPWLVRRLAGEEYRLGLPLFVAALAAGWVRLATGFADATVTAVAPAHRLVPLNLLGGLFVPMAAAGGLLGAQLGGLTGLLYGTSLGWAGRALVGAWLAAPELRGLPTPGYPGASVPAEESPTRE